MLYTVIPYSLEKNYGAECNRMMELLGPDDWLCIVDHDALFTTHDWYRRICHAISQHPDAVFTVPTNRIGARSQLDVRAPRNDNYADHRRHGLVRTKSAVRLKDITEGPPLSGVVMVVSKAVWQQVGGFRPTGILGVDTDFHTALRAVGIKLYLMEDVYVYHYYRGGKAHDKRHLL